MLNRATMAQFEPGSTVKTVIGSYAATVGAVGVHEGIECTGYLVVPDARTGRPVRIASSNRCWIASMFANDSRVASVAHHQVPYPHQGRFGNPDGFLILPDALERSCNVYFETVADRLHLNGVHNAMDLFGLGSRTEVGIPEVAGGIPKPHPLPPGAKYDGIQDRKECWLAGIGQGPVAATPIQMANVAATIARDGIWMRPRLLTGENVRLALKSRPDDVRNLHLSKEALDAVHEGMLAVVYSDAGTGVEPRMSSILKAAGIKVAAKTGSAQASKLSVPIRDAQGHELREPDANGVPNKGARLWQTIPPNTLEWYQGTGVNKDHLAHAWFIGYAPADKPKIAFCVFVEYGGSGGHVAGAVARDILEACVKHRYFDQRPGVAAAEVRAKP
jgi:penicillin-binding protein 2